MASKANPWDGKTFSEDGLRMQLETSLSSLQTSCLDIFYLHAPDHSTPLEETLRAVDTLHRGGWTPLVRFTDQQSSWFRGEIQRACIVQLRSMGSGKKKLRYFQPSNLAVYIGAGVPHLPVKWLGLTHSLSRDVQCHHQVCVCVCVCVCVRCSMKCTLSHLVSKPASVTESFQM